MELVLMGAIEQCLCRDSGGVQGAMEVCARIFPNSHIPMQIQRTIARLRRPACRPSNLCASFGSPPTFPAPSKRNQ